MKRNSNLNHRAVEQDLHNSTVMNKTHNDLIFTGHEKQNKGKNSKGEFYNIGDNEEL